MAYEKALSIKPDYPEALNNLGNVLRDKGCFEKAFKAYDRALSFAIGYAEAYSNKLYCAASTFSVSSEKYLSLARGFNKITALKIEKKQFPKRHNVIKTKLRIGFVSGDFKDHPVGYFCENLIKNLDSKIFETFAFSNSNIITEQTSVLKSHMEGWHSIYGVSDDIVAELIHDQKLDVLIDLSGHTAKNRLPLFAYRPAPLQVTWLGFLCVYRS